MLDVNQFTRLIVLPILGFLSPDIPMTPVATRLVLETIFHESDRLTYIAQKPNDNPAHGLLQMERPTFNWLIDDFLPKQKFWPKFNKLSPNWPNIQFNELDGNLFLCVAMCRIRYYAVPKPLPENTLIERANYWYTYYNGSGVPQRKAQYITNSEYLASLLS